jgi:hypothetical protein
MTIIRNVFRLKFGKAREAVALFKEGVAIQQMAGANFSQRILTDLTGPFYTVVLELTAPSLGAFEAEAPKIMGNPEFQANFQKIVPLVEIGIPRDLHCRGVERRRSTPALIFVYRSGLNPRAPNHRTRLTNRHNIKRGPIRRLAAMMAKAAGLPSGPEWQRYTSTTRLERWWRNRRRAGRSSACAYALHRSSGDSSHRRPV